MILLVEDDEDVCFMLQLTLESRGYKVEPARTGRAALEALERMRPSLMILDLVMPGMTGWEVLAEMKARKLDGIPVCVISANDGEMPAEAADSLRKPFAPAKLCEIAARYCVPDRTPG